MFSFLCTLCHDHHLPNRIRQVFHHPSNNHCRLSKHHAQHVPLLCRVCPGRWSSRNLCRKLSRRSLGEEYPPFPQVSHVALGNNFYQMSPQTFPQHEGSRPVNPNGYIPHGSYGQQQHQGYYSVPQAAVPAQAALPLPYARVHIAQSPAHLAPAPMHPAPAPAHLAPAPVHPTQAPITTQAQALPPPQDQQRDYYDATSSSYPQGREGSMAYHRTGTIGRPNDGLAMGGTVSAVGSEMQQNILPILLLTPLTECSTMY